MNIFPGMGGVETVTSNLIEAIRKDNDIYVLAFESSYGFPLP